MTWAEERLSEALQHQRESGRLKEMARRCRNHTEGLQLLVPSVSCAPAGIPEAIAYDLADLLEGAAQVEDKSAQAEAQSYLDGAS